jgi:hypothetical protein
MNTDLGLWGLAMMTTTIDGRVSMVLPNLIPCYQANSPFTDIKLLGNKFVGEVRGQCSDRSNGIPLQSLASISRLLRQWNPTAVAFLIISKWVNSVQRQTFFVSILNRPRSESFVAIPRFAVSYTNSSIVGLTSVASIPHAGPNLVEPRVAIPVCLTGLLSSAWSAIKTLSLLVRSTVKLLTAAKASKGEVSMPSHAAPHLLSIKHCNTNEWGAGFMGLDDDDDDK